MSSIRILDEDVSNRIAAGEVVERPASIVKELVENALDAEADRVSISVERGGRSLVRVVDNGCGMDAEDAVLCLEAHATSKIRTTQDIDNIGTLGFRGEAIPSIASVSRFTLRTRRHNEDEGTEVTVNGGVINNVTSVGCAPGTSVTVRNLFYNMPARRKFLRAISTEEGHIHEIALVLALANPQIGVELTFDQRAMFAVQPGQDLRTRAAMLLGRDTMEAMLEVDYEDSGIRVTGFTARPGLTRSSRKDQRVFVNGRPVWNSITNNAVREAYHTLVMKGRYPPALLFVQLDPGMVDINVHPAKREVRFRDGRSVGRVVATAVQNALRHLAAEPPAANDVPLQDIPPAPAMQPLLTDVAPPRPITPIIDNASALPQPEPLPDSETASESAAPATTPAAPAEIPPIVEADERRAAGTAVSAATQNEIIGLRILGTLGRAYVLAESRDGLVLIDQHAAHERVMFERFLRQARETDGASQQLLIPVTMEVSAADARVLRKYNDELSKLGFEIENFGGNTFIVAAIPPHFPQENIVGILRDILDDLEEGTLGRRRPDEHQLATAACKAAVKAHDDLSRLEIDTLLEQLVKTEMPYTCPHGRPTMIKISYQELEKRFGRRAPAGKDDPDR